LVAGAYLLAHQDGDLCGFTEFGLKAAYCVQRGKQRITWSWWRKWPDNREVFVLRTGHCHANKHQWCCFVMIIESKKW